MGILTAWQLRKWIEIREGNAGKMVGEGKEDDPAKKNPLKRIDIHPAILFPLGAGATLVGMFSGGENTDVAGHIMGFLSGLVMGIGYFYLMTILFRGGSPRHHDDDFLDRVFTLIAIAMVILAWFKWLKL